MVTAGSFDVLAEVVAESDEDLLEIISDRIRAIPGVVTTETFVYLQPPQADLQLGREVGVEQASR